MEIMIYICDVVLLYTVKLVNGHIDSIFRYKPGIELR